MFTAPSPTGLAPGAFWLSTSGHPQASTPEVALSGPAGVSRDRDPWGQWGQREGGRGRSGLGADDSAGEEALSGCGGAGREELAGKGLTIINLSLSVPVAFARRGHGRGPEARGLQEIQ